MVKKKPTEKPIEMPVAIAPVLEIKDNNRAVIEKPIVKVAVPPPVVNTTANVRLEMVTGMLDIMPDGQGFVRPKYTPSPKDAFLAQVQVKRYHKTCATFLPGHY
jgi:transcription termination factor Rho